MKISARIWRGLGIALAVIVVAGVVGVAWGVPAVIRGQLAARYGGKLAFSGWWLDNASAGVKGLALHEGAATSSPVWARADRVATDLSLGGLVRGRVAPTKITLFRPDIVFRLDADGKPLTLPPLKGGGSSPAVLPKIAVQSGRITIHQEGRPEMQVGPLEATMQAGPGGDELAAELADTTWGNWSARGLFASDFASGKIDLKSQGAVSATPEKCASIPFVPAELWSQLSPRGPIGLAMSLETGPHPRVVVEGDLRGMTLKLPTLGITTEATTGHVTIDDRTVRLVNIRGVALGGTVSASGTLDFAQDPPRIDLALGLEKIDIARTPASWQLAQSGITGRLTGKARLLVTLKKTGVDLSGSEGDAVVDDATIEGVAVKGLKLAMKAEGNVPKYTTGDPQARLSPRLPALAPPEERAHAQLPALAPPRERADAQRRGEGEARRVLLSGQPQPGRPGSAPSPDPSPPQPDAETSALSPTGASAGEGHPGFVPALVATLPQQAPAARPVEPKTGGFTLPKSISTEVSFQDVDLVQVIAKARALGIPLPFAITGKLSMNARATIPLGAIREIKGYAFHGDAALKGASIDGVDLGAVDGPDRPGDAGCSSVTELAGASSLDRPRPAPRDQSPAGGDGRPLRNGRPIADREGSGGDLHAEIDAAEAS